MTVTTVAVPHTPLVQVNYIYTSGTTEDLYWYRSLAACQERRPLCSEHNHVGNYYNWSAAVASNDTNTTELSTRYGSASTSICPAGWRLPKILGQGTRTTDSEFGSMLVAEGVISNPILNYQDFNIDGLNKIRAEPLWLAWSGYINYINDGYFTNSGDEGHYWSSTAYSGYDSYGLYFHRGNSSPTNTHSRYVGYSVRCLIK